VGDAAIMAVTGMCLGALRLLESAFLFLKARGDAEQISDAKNILLHSVAGMAIIAVTFFVMVF
jgi:hypothetical protein